MDREALVLKLEELKKSAEEKAIAYNEAMGDEKKRSKSSPKSTISPANTPEHQGRYALRTARTPAIL